MCEYEPCPPSPLAPNTFQLLDIPMHSSILFRTIRTSYVASFPFGAVDNAFHVLSLRLDRHPYSQYRHSFDLRHQ